MTTIDQMIQREVLCCMSSLVSTLVKISGYPLSAQHVSRETKSDCNGLFGQASELAYPVLDYEEAATEAGWVKHVGGFHIPKQPDAEDHTSKSWQELCDAHNLDPCEWEVYEHWAVSQWLAEKLIAQGERVDTDFAGLNIWARTTTGQAIAMDGCIARIYADMMMPAEAGA